MFVLFSFIINSGIDSAGIEVLPSFIHLKDPFGKRIFRDEINPKV